MNRDEALEIAMNFLNYIRKSDEGYVEKYTKKEILCALSLISPSDRNHQWYKEMEKRIEKLDEQEKGKGKGKEACQISNIKFLSLTDKSIWSDIEHDYGETKRGFGKKINFVTEIFKRSLIFRDVEQAYVLANAGFFKPAVILSGGIVEELLIVPGTVSA